MVVTLAYVAVLALGALCIAVRHGPIVLRGRSVVWLNGIVFGVQILFRPSPVLLWLPLFAIIFGVSLLGVRTWFIFKDDPATLANAIETRLRRVLVEYSRDQSGYHLSLDGQPASIRFHRLWAGFQTLTFGGNWQDNKAKVAQRYLSKYGEPVVPRPRFRV